MIFAWIKAYFLRMIKRPAIIAAVAVMVLLSALLAISSGGEMQGFACGMLRSDDENVMKIFEALKDEKTVLDIKIFDDEDEMLRAQRRGELRFAYVFDEDFTEKYEENDAWNTIIRFSDKDDIFAALADEIVFAKTAEIYADVLIKNFVLINPHISYEYRDEVEKTALVMYDEYMDVLGDVFVYETLDGKVINTDGGSAAFPVRGVCAILVLTAALLGMQTVLSDEEKALYHRLSPSKKNTARLIGIAIPTVFLSLGTVVCVALSNVGVNLLHEIFSALLLICSCTAFAYFISAFLKDPDSAAMIIPLTVLLTVALCPIFFDIAALVPALKFVSGLLPPYYYLHAASKSIVGVAGSVLTASIYLIAGLLIRRIRNR